MKTGLSLTELAAKLEANKQAQKDYTVHTKGVSMTESGDLTFRSKEGSQVLPVTAYAHGQIASYVQIPKAYYDRLKDSSPALLQKNVNHWLGKQEDKRFVRTQHGQVRAWLSDRYRPYDNVAVAETALQAIMSASCSVESCEVTDRRLYLKVVSPKVSYEITKGDIVQAGLVISNSEIGAGSLKVEPLIYRLVCTNGMIAAESAFRKNHAGKALSMGMEGIGDQAIEFFSDETRKLSDQAVFAQIRDLVSGVLSDEGFSKLARKMQASTEDKIEKDVFEAIEVFTKRNSLSEEHGRGILGHLLADRDLSRYGLLNAVTRYSQDIDDYDLATDFERLGGQVLEMSPSSWKEIAQTA